MKGELNTKDYQKMEGKMEKDRQGFVFFRSYANCIRNCPKDAQLALFWAIVDYSLDFEQPDFSIHDAAGFLRAIWEGIRPNLDGNINRFKNGSKGGAPKGNKNASKKKQPKNNQKQPKNNQKQPKNNRIKNIEKEIEKNIEDSLFGAGDETPAQTKTLSFPFQSQKFQDTWKELCRQPKWKKKSIDALQKSLNKIAAYPEDYAIVLMEDAIANDYQGLVFASTPANFEQWKKNNPGQPQRKEGRPLSKEDLV